EKIVPIIELNVDYFDDPDPFNCNISFSRDSTMLSAIGGFCNGLHLWNLTTGRGSIISSGKFLDEWGCRYCVPFFNSQNEPIVVRFNSDFTQWWNVATGFIGESVDEEYRAIYWPRDVKFNSKDTIIFVMQDAPIAIYLLVLDFETGETISLLEFWEGIESVEFSPDGSYFAVETFGEISIRKTRTPDVEIVLLSKGETNLTYLDGDMNYFPKGINFSLNGDLLASNQMIWDTETWEPIVTLPESFMDPDYQGVKKISPDGSLLWTRNGLWDVEEERIVKEVQWDAVAPNWKLVAQWETEFSESSGPVSVKLVLLGIPKVTESDTNTTSGSP
ncbi:MAG: hypothetical protein JXB47_08600, partial [Anaerolineae bacterium]|nr:hypothetical protein [Anaerolineae bacterium]